MMIRSREISALLALGLISALAIGIGSCKSPTSSGVVICDVPPVGPESSIHTPSWSTDGTRIAFHSAYDSLGNLVFGWYETDTLGSYKKPLGIDGATMRWMPGDSQIVTSVNGDFALFDLNTKQTTFLGLTPRQVIFDISPSGKYLYYTQVIPDSGDISGIYRYDFQSRESIKVVGGFALHPEISEGDSLLAFIRPGPVPYILNLRTGEERLLNAELPPLEVDSPRDDLVNHMRWIDNNNSLLIHTSARRIGIVSLDGNFRFLTCGLGWISSSNLDSSILHVWSDNDHGWQIWRINIDGSDKRRITFFR